MNANNDANKANQAKSTTALVEAMAAVQSAQPALSGLPVFALIDPYFDEPSGIDIPSGTQGSLQALHSARATAWAREITSAQRDDLALDAAKLPYLVTLRDAQDPWLEQLVDQSQQAQLEALASGESRFSSGTFIETELSAAALMTRLEKMWRVKMLGELRHLRIAAPRTVQLLAHLRGVDRLADWLGPIHGWHAMGFESTWRCWPGRVAVLDPADELALYRRAAQLQELTATEPHLHLGVPECQRLQASETASRTVLGLLQQGWVYSAALLEAVWQATEHFNVNDSRTPTQERVAHCTQVVERQAARGGLPGATPAVLAAANSATDSATHSKPH